MLAGQVQYNSGVWYEQNNIVGSGGLDDDGYSLVNATLSWRGADQRWTVSLHGTNLLDEEYVGGGIDIGDGLIKSGIDGAPRMVGVSLQLEF
ncbi:MAG TPA: hypothetical protein VJM11_04530 [Nevskiaceae bacterium]|nr:hypothetical protein [Nevskiaceae bacterium]